MNDDENRCTRPGCNHSVEEHEEDGSGECSIEWCSCEAFVKSEA